MLSLVAANVDLIASGKGEGHPVVADLALGFGLVARFLNDNNHRNLALVDGSNDTESLMILVKEIKMTNLFYFRSRANNCISGMREKSEFHVFLSEGDLDEMIRGISCQKVGLPRYRLC